MAWPVFPRAKQGKVIIGPGFTHGVFHFRGELVFLDAHARIFKERLRADIGDLGRFDDVVYFLPGLFSGYFFDDVVGGPDLGFLADGKAGCLRHFRQTCHTHGPGHPKGGHDAAQVIVEVARAPDIAHPAFTACPGLVSGGLDQHDSVTGPGDYQGIIEAHWSQFCKVVEVAGAEHAACPVGVDNQPVESLLFQQAQGFIGFR